MTGYFQKKLIWNFLTMTGFVLFMTNSVHNITLLVPKRTGFVLTITEYVVNITVCVLNMTGVVPNMTLFVLKITGLGLFS